MVAAKACRRRRETTRGSLTLGNAAYVTISFVISSIVHCSLKKSSNAIRAYFPKLISKHIGWPVAATLFTTESQNRTGEFDKNGGANIYFWFSSQNPRPIFFNCVVLQRRATRSNGMPQKDASSRDIPIGKITVTRRSDFSR